MPGSFIGPSSKSVEQIHFIYRPARGCHSRVVASSHLITVDAGLLLGCCRADAQEQSKLKKFKRRSRFARVQV